MSGSLAFTMVSDVGAVLVGRISAGPLPPSPEQLAHSSARARSQGAFWYDLFRRDILRTRHNGGKVELVTWCVHGRIVHCE